jgi:hypothetical protein
MSKLLGVVTCPATALSPAVAKTIIQLVAPTNQRLRVLRWHLAFDGQSSTDQPVQFRLLRQTTAGTMTGATPRKLDNDLTETLLATAQIQATAEPTAGEVVDIGTIHPQISDGRVYAWPLEVIVGGGTRLGLEVQAPAGVNVRAWLVYEE